MDPVTLIGLVAGTTQIIGQIIGAKQALGIVYSKFKTAQLAISSITAQLSALEASTIELEAILKNREASLRSRKSLLAALNQSLSACSDVIQYLSNQLTPLTAVVPARTSLSRWTRAKFALNESDLAPMKEALRDQVQAIQLLLSVVSLGREDEQVAVLNDTESVRVLDTAANRSSTLLQDSGSIMSSTTRQSDTLSRVSTIFNFDGELLGSGPYRTAVLRTWKGLKGEQKPATISPPPRDSRVSMLLEGRPDTDTLYQLSGMKSTVVMVVQYDFEPERPDEWGCQTGQIVIPVAVSTDEWVVVKPIDRLGGPGLVPIRFMVLVSRTGDRYTTQDDILNELKAVGIPDIRAWKRAASRYKSSAIPIDVFQET
ncbi:hypothetical protein F4808DRAFT_444051 [Astrocystis sublimbata]|nr:hypothetical protein F4808DRAFT_444051 [Astrocystis sublimbata]